MGLASLATARFLGPLSGGLGLALVASASFAWLQSERLGAAKETHKADVAQIEALKGAVSSRDTLITKQNAAVRQLQEQSEADRSEYLARLAQADSRAKALQSQADRLLAATTTATDELGRCRAAVQLITDTLKTEEGED